MSIPIFQVDAFTSRPFGGNPAGVCLLDRSRDEDWMQALAAEMNLSETAFLLAEGDAFRLRWFTPTHEVALCGHATLAGAHVLWETGRADGGRRIRFLTRSGELVASRGREGLELDFPSLPVTEASMPPVVGEALGLTPEACGHTSEKEEEANYLLLLGSESEVRSLRPDFRRLERGTRSGVIVTARADSPEFDFVSRCFFPAWGIDEDSVTGSAHCSLAPFWAPRLGKSELVGLQASARGGTVRVRLEGERVRLIGEAVTVFKGELTAAALGDVEP